MRLNQRDWNQRTWNKVHQLSKEELKDVNFKWSSKWKSVRLLRASQCLIVEPQNHNSQLIHQLIMIECIIARSSVLKGCCELAGFAAKSKLFRGQRPDKLKTNCVTHKHRNAR